jgi:hypothetical protein
VASPERKEHSEKGGVMGKKTPKSGNLRSVIAKKHRKDIPQEPGVDGLELLLSIVVGSNYCTW